MQALMEQQIAWKIPLPLLDQKMHNQARVNKCAVVHLTVKNPFLTSHGCSVALICFLLNRHKNYLKS